MWGHKLIFIILTLIVLSVSNAQLIAQKWWQTATFYQIYPRSFQDSNGDGIGDLKGISQKLSYLKEIGVTATWLSPIMKSPMVDFGYDISNFYEIDPIFGNMNDFDEMVANARKLGIKIIMDFVPNHTSDECEWFIKSVAGDPEYKDFYVWHSGKIVNGVRQPPTNWIAAFRGSMWTWNEQRQAYYLHQFHRKQVDLNFRNPAVVEKIKDVIRFWMRKGIDGLRIDSVPYLFEIAPDAEGNLPDEPRNSAVSDPEDYDSNLHIYTNNQPETIDLLYQFRAVMDEIAAELKTDETVILAEAYAPLDILMQYYGNDTTEGAQIPFNTELIVNIEKSSNAEDFKRVIYSWLNIMPEKRTANWVIGNHDRQRVGTRLGRGRIDMMNILTAVLPGGTITYYGEEIGMTDVYISWKDTVDPQACQANEKIFERLSRDPSRTPMQWNNEPYAGFSNKKPWLPLSLKYEVNNIKNQRAVLNSHLNVFKNLRNLRKAPTFTHGDVEVEALNKNVLMVKRSLKGYPTYLTLFNVNDALEHINLDNLRNHYTDYLINVIVTQNGLRRKGDRTNLSSIYLMPHETVVFEFIG